MRVRTLVVLALTLVLSVAVGTLIGNARGMSGVGVTAGSTGPRGVRGTGVKPRSRTKPPVRQAEPTDGSSGSGRGSESGSSSSDSEEQTTRAPVRRPATGAAAAGKPKRTKRADADPAATTASAADDDPPDDRWATVVERAAHPVLPTVWRVPRSGDPAPSTKVVRCANVGMQEKCLFRYIAVKRNRFTVCGKGARSLHFPNPIFLPDGQRQPLIQYHRYRGHPVAVEDACECAAVVERPAVFLFRMSGHSTYHLWENNLGPFYATLQEFPEVKAAVNDPAKLLVVFADDKPASGPKAPHLLDQLLRSFSDRPLINASNIVGPGGSGAVCFADAVLGTSANSFPHMALLHQMMRNIVGYAPPPPLPEAPRALWISRNHPSVIRGRKIANEREVVAAVNATLLELTGRPLQYVQMETLRYPEQVALAMKTNIMLSPHGGGVANCIWMAKGSVMVEFVAPVGKTLLNMYHSMCGKSGVKHISFLSDPDPADAKLSDAQLNNNRRLFSNMVVPIDKIVEHTRKAVELFAAARRKQQAGKGAAPPS